MIIQKYKDRTFACCCDKWCCKGQSRERVVNRGTPSKKKRNSFWAYLFEDGRVMSLGVVVGLRHEIYDGSYTKKRLFGHHVQRRYSRILNCGRAAIRWTMPNTSYSYSCVSYPWALR